MSDFKNKLIFSTDEAAKLCGISKTYIYREINAGRLKAVKYGKRTLIKLEAIRSWVEALPSYKDEEA